MGDPIEVGAVRKTQIKMPRLEPLMITSNKTNIGHLEGAAAMGGICKCVLQCAWGKCLPTLHLRSLNPHLEHEAFDAIFQTEGARYHYTQGHSQVSSFGFGGSNGHAVIWGAQQGVLDDDQKLILNRIKKLAAPEVRVVGKDPSEWEFDFPDPVKMVKKGLKYKIELNAEDTKATAQKWELVDDDDDEDETFEREESNATYHITGNFNDWETDRMAEGDVPGLYTITVEAPPSGNVEFRFLRDGEADQVIAPANNLSSKKTGMIMGPSKGLTNKWLIQAKAGKEVKIELMVKRTVKCIMWMVEKDKA